MNNREVLEYLVYNNYVQVLSTGRICPTSKFQDLKSMDCDAKSWDKMYLKFIKDTEVPALLYDLQGHSYAANLFTQDGLKSFKKALQGGISYESLVDIVKSYYKSEIRFKKTIGNYMKDNMWYNSNETAPMEEEQKNVGSYEFK